MGDQGIDGRISIKILLKEIGWEDVDWINVALDEDKWWAAVNLVLKFLVS